MSGKETFVEVKAEYQWWPQVCTTCQLFGHSNSDFRKYIVQKYVEKTAQGYSESTKIMETAEGEQGDHMEALEVEDPDRGSL